MVGPRKQMGGSCPKNSRITESFQQRPLRARGEGEVWLVVANFLMSDPLFLKSGHNQVTMFLKTSTRTNIILCSDKKGQGPKAF